MADKATRSSASPLESMSIFDFGKQNTEATLNIQKELLDAYEQASRAWLARVQSEVDLWSQLATKLTATRSVPEALGAYQESVAQRMQMAAEDGRKLSDEGREVLRKITQSMSKGWGTESS
jgi:Phasin protein